MHEPFFPLFVADGNRRGHQILIVVSIVRSCSASLSCGERPRRFICVQ